MNELYVGFSNEIELPKSGCLFIGDEVPNARRSRLFDVSKHSFNPLKGRDYRKSCAVVEIFDALFGRGDSTLTKDTGLDFLFDCLETKATSFEDLVPEPDKKSSTGHIWAHSKVRRVLRSPVLRKVLCGSTNFSFNPRSVILARVSRRKLGEFDALALGLFLMAHYDGQIVVPDFGFYARDLHSSLIREERLSAGVKCLAELEPRLRQMCLLIEDKKGRRCTYEDAEALARYEGFVPDTNAYLDFVQRLMRG